MVLSFKLGLRSEIDQLPQEVDFTHTPCDGLDGADLHTAPTCPAAASSELDTPSTCSNPNLPELSRREPRCLKGQLILPGLLASGSAAEERKTADREKRGGKDDGESRAGRRRPPHQPITAKRKKPRSRWSHPGTKETTSGKQDLSASHASGEAWQTLVRGVFGGRGLGGREET
ncbi:hypothetical protein NDU88_000566 [Pleurodeles waltl]|uniref:Uncharacterized protein n=1 Tax=Pleurodeles waltl TaxID=8319 RepID=A0AAV7S501_PLEWA|nr:hypothetical protein NDU88_000566 [Pleurodeles waltl]